MQLDRIEAVIRPRSAWEATDLGVLMATRWWWPMLKAWLTITAPVFVMLLFVPGESWYGPLVFWWLKPLWERIHLHIVSRALFGDVPGVRATCREFARVVFRRIFPALLWMRLSGYRSMDAPVMQLEDLKGKRYRQRVKLLHAEDQKPARYLLIACATLETLLFFAFGLLLSSLIPQQMESTVGQALLADDSAVATAMQYLLWYACMTLVAPFYVAAGFALYINRRVKLEAWDIEIDFKKMAAAHQRQKPPLLAGAAAKVALLLVAFALPLGTHDGGVFAAEAEQGVIRATDQDAARDSIDEVMARAEFHDVEVRTTPQIDPELAATINRWVQKVLEFFRVDNPPDAAWFFATLVEVLMWIALLGIIALLLFNYRHWLRAGLFSRRVATGTFSATSHNPLATSIDPRDATLPADIAAAVRALYAQGAVLEAVALLYRASLVVFTRAHRFTFPDSTTEGEHLAKVRSTLAPGTAAYFAALSRVWLFIAYGKRAPDASHLLALCDSWQQEWERAVHQQAGGNSGATP